MPPNYMAPQMDENKKPNSKKKIIYGVLITVLVLIVAGGAFWFESVKTQKHNADLARMEVELLESKTKNEKLQKDILEKEKRQEILEKERQAEILGREERAKSAAVSGFYEVHRNITARNYASAYQRFSPRITNKMTYSGWESGYSDTISSEVLTCTAVSATEKGYSWSIH